MNYAGTGRAGFTTDYPSPKLGGDRTNLQAGPMRLEAAHLTVPEMIDVAAYAASRKP